MLGTRARLRPAGGVALLLVLLGAANGLAVPRVVAVGDVHGDLPAFPAILADAELVDSAGSWTGGDATLVQLGDLIDRGPSMRATLDYVMRLEAEASRRGGTVVVLLGNHEVMNMTGDLRYVAAENYAEFADAGSEKRRADAWAELEQFRKRRREPGLPEPPTGPEARKAWLGAHPNGFLERQEAFGPRGVYGRWLRSKSACVVLGSTAFFHGGLSPADAKLSLDEINRRVKEDLAAYDADRELFAAEGLILPFFDFSETTRAVREGLAAPSEEGRRAAERFLDFGNWIVNAADGPLWFRGYSQWTDAEGAAEISRLAEAAGVDRFVVAHTVQRDGRIRERFEGRVFLIDTGMLDGSFFPGGRASALEISDGVVSAIYPGRRREVLERAPAKKVAARPVPSRRAA